VRAFYPGGPNRLPDPESGEHLDYGVMLGCVDVLALIIIGLVATVTLYGLWYTIREIGQLIH